MTITVRQQNVLPTKKKNHQRKKYKIISAVKQLCGVCARGCVCSLYFSSWEHGLSSSSVMNLPGITVQHTGIPMLLSMLSNNKRYVNVFKK